MVSLIKGFFKNIHLLDTGNYSSKEVDVQLIQK